ncbi:cyclic nucleotide-binding domain-containing protein [bacterium]|nr:cyclic nucleotide-binding domain-containing protein [bacterium]
MNVVVEVDRLELREALGATELCEGLAVSELDRLADLGEVHELSRGDVLFSTNEPAECIYLLLEGAIEIVRPTDESARPVPVAYITPGEMIGDMALLTGTPRRSDARVPESALIWKLSRERFEQFTMELPRYGIQLARMYARRLQDLITHMRRQARRKELSGKLRYFDMPTVVQTLLTTGQTGILTFTCESGEVFAEVVLGKGFVDRARCGRIEGEEAFHEIFLRRDEGEFSFRSALGTVADAVSTRPINVPAMHLMMEAIRRADEIESMRHQLGATDREYRALTETLQHDRTANVEVARALHRALREPGRLEGIRPDIDCTTYEFYTTAAILVATDQIG